MIKKIFLLPFFVFLVGFPLKSVLGHWDILDFSDLNLIGSYDTQGDTHNVFIYKNNAYIFDYSKGMIILNISNPKKPKLVGTFKKNEDFSYFNDLVVSDTVAYIADSRNGLEIIDISNPKSPKLISEYPSELINLKISGDTIYATGNKFSVIDISDTSFPTLVTTLDINGGEIEISGNKAYVISGKQFFVIDILNPNSPVIISQIDTYKNFTQLQIAGEKVYVSDSDGFYEVDISDILSLKLVFKWGAEEVGPFYVSEDKLYIETEDDVYGGLDEVDISNPSDYRGERYFRFDESAHSFSNFIVENRIMYMAFGKKGFKVYDLDGPAKIYSVKISKEIHGFVFMKINGEGFGFKKGMVLFKKNGKITEMAGNEIDLWSMHKIEGFIPWGVKQGKVKICIEKPNAVKSNSKNILYKKRIPRIKKVYNNFNSDGTISFVGWNFGPQGSKTEKVLVKGGTASVTYWTDSSISINVESVKKNKLKIYVKTRYGKSNKKVIDLKPQ